MADCGGRAPQAPRPNLNKRCEVWEITARLRGKIAPHVRRDPPLTVRWPWCKRMCSDSQPAANTRAVERQDQRCGGPRAPRQGRRGDGAMAPTGSRALPKGQRSPRPPSRPGRRGQRNTGMGQPDAYGVRAVHLAARYTARAACAKGVVKWLRLAAKLVPHRLGAYHVRCGSNNPSSRRTCGGNTAVAVRVQAVQFAHDDQARSVSGLP